MATKRTFTASDILAMRPCENYPRSRIEELWAGRVSLTPTEITHLDIPIPDRLWAVLRPDAIGARACRLLACDFASHVLPLFESRHPDDDRPRVAIETARRYAAGGATSEELAVAEIAAEAAAEAAAANSAREAPYPADAAWAAARVTADAWAVAWAAARAATRAAAQAAADAWADAWAGARAVARAAAAADDTAWAAARAAADAAARAADAAARAAADADDAEREWQLARVRGVLIDNKKKEE